MVDMNNAFLKGRNGILRILTLILGAITIGLTADSYLKTGKEEFMLAMTIILFIISFIWVILVIFGVLPDSDATRKIDFLFHIIGGLVLIISGIVWIVSVMEYINDTNVSSDFICKTAERLGTSTPNPCKKAVRIIAFVLVLINGIIYCLLGFLLAKSTPSVTA